MPPRVWSVLSLLLAVLTGLVVGAAGSFLQASWTGLILALALTVAASVAALARSARAGAGLTLAGWLLAVLPASLTRPEGDLVVVGDLRGYLWLLGGTMIGGLLVGVGPLAVPAWLQPVARAVENP